MDYLFEMTACMDPFLSQLTIIDSLASSPRHAAKVKSIVWEKVVALATQLAEAADRHSEDMKQNANSDQNERRIRQQSLTSGGGLKQQQRWQQQHAQGGEGKRKNDTGRGDGDTGQNSNSDDGGDRPSRNNSPRLDPDNESDEYNTTSPRTKRQKLAHKPGNYGGTDRESRSEGGDGVARTVSVTPVHTNTPSAAALPQQDSSEDVRFILESGLFGAAPSTPKCNEIERIHRERAEAELESFKALGSKRVFGSPPLESLLSFWAAAEGSGRCVKNKYSVLHVLERAWYVALCSWLDCACGLYLINR